MLLLSLLLLLFLINLTLLAQNILSQYFFLVSLKYLKTDGNGLNLFIIHFWLITYVFQCAAYMLVYKFISLFLWDSRDIRDLWCRVLEFL